MPKTKCTAKFQIIEFIDQFVDGATAKAIGGTVVDTAKELIASGQSPVRGEGRFERYKNREKYPGKLKNASPVNLELSGDMLRGYGYERKGKNDIVVGMVKGSSKVKEIASYHNDGTPTIAQRQIVPKEGQEWSPTIMRAIADGYSKRLVFLIKKSNNKG